MESSDGNTELKLPEGYILAKPMNPWIAAIQFFGAFIILFVGIWLGFMMAKTTEPSLLDDRKCQQVVFQDNQLMKFDRKRQFYMCDREG